MKCGFRFHVVCSTSNLLKRLPRVRAFKTKIYLLWFRDLPLYLEWAPDDILSEDPTYKKDENDTSIVGEHETKLASLEQELEGTTNADIDTERVEVRCNHSTYAKAILNLRLYLFWCICFFLWSYQSRSLFVKNLNFKTTDESLKKHFVDHVKKGKLRSVRVIPFVPFMYLL